MEPPTEVRQLAFARAGVGGDHRAGREAEGEGKETEKKAVTGSVHGVGSSPDITIPRGRAAGKMAAPFVLRRRRPILCGRYEIEAFAFEGRTRLQAGRQSADRKSVVQGKRVDL